MEGLKELVAASFARYGIECPEGDSQLAGTSRGQTIIDQTDLDQTILDQTNLDQTNLDQTILGQTIFDQPVRTAEPTLTSALPEHNFRKSLQGDPAP